MLEFDDSLSVRQSLMTAAAIIGVLAVVASATFGAGYYKGRVDGREKALRQAVAAYQQRNKVNEAVNTLDAFDLCRGLGGVPDECTALRGVDADAKAE